LIQLLPALFWCLMCGFNAFAIFCNNTPLHAFMKMPVLILTCHGYKVMYKYTSMYVCRLTRQIPRVLNAAADLFAFVSLCCQLHIWCPLWNVCHYECHVLCYYRMRVTSPFCENLCFCCHMGSRT
jgi:hypothetical protein